ncbi:Ig-like domain-containing protein [Bifidobacterium sp. CP2]|uniref:Ig-like domain-containing protein n=1 Tax=Bifidobacterium sp. CP2 TaxID=2809025 RepID=UPI001BDDAF3A|nr:Ig-like domain-containing protein [Bifidobacterium sp. CP2]
MDWGTIDASKYANEGTFEVTGTVLDTTVNARATGNPLLDKDGNQLTVTVKVTVKARVITGVNATSDTITVDPVKDGDPTPTVTGKAIVTWNDGDTETRADIALTLPEGWNKPHTAHTVDATGYVDGWGKAVTFTVHVNAATIESVENPGDFSTTEGVPPTLPAKTNVTWSNGQTTSEDIVWNEPENFKDLFDKAGDIVTVNGEIKGHPDKTVTVKITVTAATIESVTAPEDKTVDAGQTPNLPATLTAKLSNGNDSQVAVTWKTDGVDFSNRSGKDKTVTVKGEIKGYDKGVSVKVTIRSAKATSAAVKGDKTITVDSGTEPAFPKTASVSWSDNGKDTEEDITWDAFGKDKWNDRTGGTYTVNGVTKTSKLPVSVTVVVKAATVSSVDTKDVEVSTNVGVQPGLPKTLKVTWSNHDVTDADITWSTITAEQLAKAGTFDVTGTATVADNVYTVTAHVTVTEATVKSVEQIVDVTTSKGKAPQLPTTVKVVWSDGTVTSEPATWNEIPASAYAKAGSFQVKGVATIAGTDYELTANVTVSDNGTLVPQPGQSDKTDTGKQQLSKTGSNVAIIIAVAVVLIVIAVIVLIVVKQRKEQ